MTTAVAPLDLVCLTPLRVEAVAARCGLRNSPARGRVLVVRTGAGGVHSAQGGGAALASLGGACAVAAGPGAQAPVTLVAGVGGGLVAGLAAGELVVADAVIGPDGNALDIDLRSAPSVADALLAAGLTVRVAPVATAATFVRGATARAALAATTGAAAVDLESSILAGLAWPGPFAVVRAVVDTSDAELVAPSTIIRGIVALRALRQAAPVLAAWAAGRRPLFSTTGPF
ncbi:MAG: hypothetical protein M3063_01820 [Actinomycetota bacterium]|nr:hypothetical protein [Actinomycetota bacterium]